MFQFGVPKLNHPMFECNDHGITGPGEGQAMLLSLLLSSLYLLTPKNHEGNNGANKDK